MIRLSSSAKNDNTTNDYHRHHGGGGGGSNSGSNNGSSTNMIVPQRSIQNHQQHQFTMPPPPARRPPSHDQNNHPNKNNRRDYNDNMAMLPPPNRRQKSSQPNFTHDQSWRNNSNHHHHHQNNNSSRDRAPSNSAFYHYQQQKQNQQRHLPPTDPNRGYPSSHGNGASSSSASTGYHLLDPQSRYHFSLLSQERQRGKEERQRRGMQNDTTRGDRHGFDGNVARRHNGHHPHNPNHNHHSNDNTHPNTTTTTNLNRHQEVTTTNGQQHNDLHPKNKTKRQKEGKKRDRNNSDSSGNNSNQENQPAAASASAVAPPPVEINRRPPKQQSSVQNNTSNKKKKNDSNNNKKKPGSNNGKNTKNSTSSSSNNKKKQKPGRNNAGKTNSKKSDNKNKSGRNNGQIATSKNKNKKRSLDNQANQPRPTKRPRTTTASNKGDKSNKNKKSHGISNAYTTDSWVNGEAPASNETHIIFAIDFSFSMNERDVKTRDLRGEIVHISRWDAVFKCIDEFLSDQLTDQQQQLQDGDRDVAALAVVSVVIFNQEPTVLLERMPLIGNGDKVREAFRTAQKANVPKLGTSFSAGFQITEHLANKHKGADTRNNKVVVVFLSDGRPGDLRQSPPEDEFTPMQEFFTRDRVTYRAAGYYIEKMKKRYESKNDNGSNHGASDEFGDSSRGDDIVVSSRLNLNFVCLYDEGREWLEYLAKRYNGRFHMPDLTMDDDESNDGDNRNFGRRNIAPSRKPKSSRRIRLPPSDDENDDESNDSDNSNVGGRNAAPGRIPTTSRRIRLPPSDDEDDDESDDGGSIKIVGRNAAPSRQRNSSRIRLPPSDDEDASDEDDDDDADQDDDGSDYVASGEEVLSGAEDSSPGQKGSNAAAPSREPKSRSISLPPSHDDDAFEENDDYDSDQDSDYVEGCSDNENTNRGEAGNDSEEEEILEVKVKSQETLIREKYNRALASGNVCSVPSTSVRRSTSLRSTFSSISSTVTAMRHDSARLSERRVTIKDESDLITYNATRMVLVDSSESFKVAPGESSNERKVKVSLHPFAQGGLRNVYRMRQNYEARQVAKESRHDINYSERLKFHVEGCKCQAQATIYAMAFNQRVETARNNFAAFDIPTDLGDWGSVAVLHAEVYRLQDPAAPGGFRYLAVEKEMKKGEYQKWNSNNGYVNPTSCRQNEVSQTFSHFSYEQSKEMEMVVDIQGSGYTYTDPQLHSKQKQYGRADRGMSGFKDFFHTHKCNWICRAIGLKNRENDSAGSPPLGTSQGQELVKREQD